MKCIRCQHDSKYKDRGGGICPHCKGVFAFEPKTGAPFTDGAFLHAIEVVSGHGAVRFLPEHVRWQLERQAKPHVLASVLGGVLVAVVGCMISVFVVAITESPFIGAFVLVPVLLVAVGLVWAGRTRAGTARLSDDAFRTMWSRWIHVHGSPTGLIERKRLKGARPAALDAELEHYSFDRAVICDRAELVDVLLQNRFHFENNCAVLSFNGYPEAAFAMVRKMLRNNPKLLVLAVHSADPVGCRLAYRLANEDEWFKGHGRVVDVGLRPAHARFFHGQVERYESPSTVEAGNGIRADEVKWLREFRLDAMAIRPEQLVKRLFRALTEAEKTGADGGTTGGSDGSDAGGGHLMYLGLDADTVDGGADSFG